MADITDIKEKSAYIRTKNTIPKSKAAYIKTAQINMLRKNIEKPHTSQEDSHNTSADAVEQVEQTASLLGHETKQLATDGSSKMRLTMGFNSSYRTAKVPGTPQEQIKAVAIKEKEKHLKAEKSERASAIADIKTRDSEARKLQEVKTAALVKRQGTASTPAKSKDSKATLMERSKKTAQLKDFQKLQQTRTRAKQFTERISEAVSKLFATASKALSGVLATGGGVLIVVPVPLMLLLGCAAFLFGGGSSAAPVSEEVNAYSALIQLYAREHGIPEYTELIKAVMMQESAGRGNDPMQASESAYNTRYPNSPGGITDPEYSINVGIQALADVITRAGVKSPIDIENICLALQGYNFGPGYISWALNHYGGYSRENALEFSQLMAAQLGRTSYGDAQYADHVLRYYPMSGAVLGGSLALAYVAASQVGSTGGQTYWSWYGYNYRVEWCACFVSWCAAQCGVLDIDIPKFAYCPSGVEWFKDKGAWQDRYYTPSPGDVIFFDWENDGISDHVGIVESVENGLIHTVEGNINDSVVKKQYPLEDGSIYGFGIINCY